MVIYKMHGSQAIIAKQHGCKKRDFLGQSGNIGEKWMVPLLSTD